jgi:hypothetical protein
MLSIRPFHVKTVEKRADRDSAGMAARGCLGYAVVDVELVI